MGKFSLACAFLLYSYVQGTRSIVYSGWELSCCYAGCCRAARTRLPL